MAQDLASRLGKRLRVLREERGLSQEQLAVQAGLTARTVRRIEQGEDTTLGSVLTLADVLGEPLIELPDDTPDLAAS